MFNSKLYKKHYTISTIADLNNFTDTNFKKILRISDILLKDNLVTAVDIDKKHGTRMKRERSILGNLKLGNILYNENIELEREDEYRKKNIKKNNDILTGIHEKAVLNLLTIDDVNVFLDFENKYHHSNLKLILRGVIALFIILILFLFF